MFKVKLTALDHPAPDTVNIEDPNQFRNTVLWLEDQKIRHYPIDDRAGLRKVDNPKEWDAAFVKYKVDLGFPEFKSLTDQFFWLCSYAIRLEYMDNIESFKGITSEKVIEGQKQSAPSVQTKNPLDKMDFHNKEFIEGVRSLATQLDIAYHPDHLVQLRAVSKVVQENLSTEALKEPLIEGTPFPINDGSGFGLKDPDLERAARILRLLQIQSVRKLQTGINEAIVTVQNLTADPKTDTKLGKVGF